MAKVVSFKIPSMGDIKDNIGKVILGAWLLVLVIVGYFVGLVNLLVSLAFIASLLALMVLLFATIAYLANKIGE